MNLPGGQQEPLRGVQEIGGLCGAAEATFGGGAGGSRVVQLGLGLCLQLDGSALPL